MKITIIGNGNVGSHLYRAFQDKGLEVCMVNGHTLSGLSFSDLYIISVRDDVLCDVAERMHSVLGDSARVVHTAGTKSIDLLTNLYNVCGVFYPMQTFSRDKTLDYKLIPVFIEATEPSLLNLLSELATKYFGHVKCLTSAERKHLHIAAVFASNFTNHMLSIADDELRSIGLDYRIMLPLLDEVVSKLYSMSPKKAQTGPAVRCDLSVVEEHMSLINDSQKREIYRLISKSISQQD